MWLAVRSVAAFAGPDSVVKPSGASSNSGLSASTLILSSSPSPANAVAIALGVEDAVLSNSTASTGTGTAARALFPALSFAMGDLFSLSFLQILSVLSFFTSVLALVRVGSVSLHRLSHKFEAQPQQMGVASDPKAPLWNWSGSFSLGSLIGEDEDEEVGTATGYTGGSELMRMNWQVSRPVTGVSPVLSWSCAPLNFHLVHLPPQRSQPPISMAKLIMSRHVSAHNVPSSVSAVYDERTATAETESTLAAYTIWIFKSGSLFTTNAICVTALPYYHPKGCVNAAAHALCIS